MRGSIIKRCNKYSIVVDIYNEQNARKVIFISGYNSKTVAFGSNLKYL